MTILNAEQISTRSAKCGNTDQKVVVSFNTQGPLPQTSKPLPAYASLQISAFPAPVTSFVGRSEDIRVVCDLLSRLDVRLLTLVGPGGVGKTRLAVHVANIMMKEGRDFADGICFIPLAAINSVDLLLPTIAQALGLKGCDGPYLDLIKAALHNKRCLLILDNFEQLLMGAVQLNDLLACSPYLSILVTSRASLRLCGSHELAVAPLALPDLSHPVSSASLAQSAAVELFVQRVCLVRPDFQLTDTNICIVAEICASLDGLPLALELAAARMKLLSLEGLLSRLGRRLTLLTYGRGDLPPRQQTLRQTMEWSYYLLLPQERQLFWRLAIFSGSCTLQAIEAVCGYDLKEAQLLDLLSSLLDQNLVQARRQTGEEEPGFVMLETIREYALEHLERSGELATIQRKHQQYTGMWEQKRGAVSVSNAIWEAKNDGPVTYTKRIKASKTSRESSAQCTAMQPPGQALTPREIEVLRLITRGLTSIQIAQELVITPLTVNSHVRSIYGKLGVATRSAATRCAISQKLV